MLGLIAAFLAVALLLELSYVLTKVAKTRALRRELQTVYDGFAVACTRRELPLVMSMLSADVRWAKGNRVLDRAGVEASLSEFLKTLGPGSSMKFTVRSVKQQWDGAKVEARLTVTDPARAPQAQSTDWQDVWVRGPDGWKKRVGEEFDVTDSG